MIAEQKRVIRAQVRARLAAITAAARTERSSQALVRLCSQPEWQRARVIMGFLPLPDELDLSAALRDAIDAGKVICLPRYLPEKGVYGAAEYRGEALAAGKFGVTEPPPGAPEVPLKRLDLVLVPGVAFDGFGGRLGRGKGFYDRLLAGIDGLKCGVALDEQVVDRLPSEPHDVAMDFVLTPTRWLAVRRNPH
jgi:5-formyltetrahydrofolate cyclo-ligase